MDLPDKLHFIGIGGIGMSALAEIAHSRNCHVSGSDQQNSPTTARLGKLGISIRIGHDACLPDRNATVVISSAIKADNPDLVAVTAAGLRILHRSELLAMVMKGKQAITVAGTHGKTTTTAIVGHVLSQLGLDPTVIVGGNLIPSGSPVRIGASQWVVAEADESDGSFLRYDPFVSVVTNIDRDHMEYFGSVEKLVEVFRSYINRTNEDGAAVVGWDHPRVREMCDGFSGNKLAFGMLIGCDIRGINFVPTKTGCRFSAVIERDLVNVELPLFGKHNATNALCALGVARALELDVKAAAAALGSFAGVERRMSLVGSTSSVRIFDDYAHNPGKIAACIAALRESVGAGELIVVYQSHRFTRLETMYDELLGSFADASRVFVLPVYSAGEKSSEDFSVKRLATDIQRLSGVSSEGFDSFASAAAAVAARCKANTPTTVVTIGAGNINELGPMIKERLS